MYNKDIKDLKNEVWIDIKNYEELYQVSNMGRIRTHENKTTFTKKHGKRKWKQRILIPKGYNSKNVYKTGYRVDLWKNGVHKSFLVARLVAFNFYGHDINSKLTVDHLDGNRLNNKLENLDLTSLKENIRRSFETQNLHKNKKIKLTNLETGEEIILNSMSKCDDYLNLKKGYTSRIFLKKDLE